MCDILSSVVILGGREEEGLFSLLCVISVKNPKK